MPTGAGRPEERGRGWEPRSQGVACPTCTLAIPLFKDTCLGQTDHVCGPRAYVGLSYQVLLSLAVLVLTSRLEGRGSVAFLVSSSVSAGFGTRQPCTPIPLPLQPATWSRSGIPMHWAPNWYSWGTNKRELQIKQEKKYRMPGYIWTSEKTVNDSLAYVCPKYSNLTNKDS